MSGYPIKNKIEKHESAYDHTEADLWFLPGPVDGEAAPFFTAPARAEKCAEPVTVWAEAEAGLAARLARVAVRLGALDERLRRGPEGWRHHLALIETAELSWALGKRVAVDRLALWLAMHVTTARTDTLALSRMGWAVRRLSGGAGPEADLAAFLDRRDQEDTSFTDRAAEWLCLMASTELHPITRAAMGFHLWHLTGLDSRFDEFDSAITAARIAASECRGASFTPLGMGGAGGLRNAIGPPAAKLSAWLQGMETACRSAMRKLDAIEAWAEDAEQRMRKLSGKTPAALRDVFCSWPYVSAPMAEILTGSSRAAVQRNLDWMEKSGLIREVTGQARFRMWATIA